MGRSQGVDGIDGGGEEDGFAGEAGGIAESGSNVRLPQAAGNPTQRD